MLAEDLSSSSDEKEEEEAGEAEAEGRPHGQPHGRAPDVGEAGGAGERAMRPPGLSPCLPPASRSPLRPLSALAHAAQVHPAQTHAARHQLVPCARAHTHSASPQPASPQPVPPQPGAERPGAEADPSDSEEDRPLACRPKRARSASHPAPATDYAPAADRGDAPAAQPEATAHGWVGRSTEGDGDFMQTGEPARVRHVFAEFAYQGGAALSCSPAPPCSAYCRGLYTFHGGAGLQLGLHAISTGGGLRGGAASATSFTADSRPQV